jgi:elongation factor G
MAVEPVRTQDRDRMLHALARVTRDDPTLRCVEDPETGQVLLSGMGELHLEVVKNRLLDTFHVAVDVGRPRVSYRQTVRGPARGEATFERLVGDRAHFARVAVEVDRDEDTFTWTVEYDVPKDVIPAEFRDTIIEAVRAALASGGSIGLPLSQVRARVAGGEHRPGLSTSVAFAAAASQALDQAIESAGSVVLEPVMRFEIEIPDEYYGVVSNDLVQRRGMIRESDVEGEARSVRGLVPLAEVFGYTGVLRSLTHGRGSLSLEPDSYRPVPDGVAHRFLGD